MLCPPESPIADFTLSYNYPDVSSSSQQRRSTLSARIEALRVEIAILKGQWPRHSVPPSMLWRMEELEDELLTAQQQLQDLEHD